MRRIAAAPGVVIAVHDLATNGRADASALVVHAAGFCARAYEPVAQLLAPYRCWGVDLRGHGDSAMPADASLHWSAFADDILATIAALGIHRPFAMGHSLGATALLLAEQRLPGAFQALYCYEPLIPPERSALVRGGNPLVAATRARRERFASTTEAYEHFAARPPMMRLHPDVLRSYVLAALREDEDGSMVLKCRPEIEARLYEPAAEPDYLDGLRSVTCPVTIARGAIDGSDAAFRASEIAARLPFGRVETFDDLGHLGPLEDPARVAQSIAAAFRAIG